ncbi:DUF1877 family protein [Moraxella oblonga]|uniref:DUF1877 family protein n=1 Tax=Moraxella oblonga TaxID=200413 RepID=UPI0008324767|nr:DUF1877 family protein [Moraxella oblonga]
MSMQCELISIPVDKISDYWQLSESGELDNFEVLDLGQSWHALSFILSNPTINLINATQLEDVIMAKNCLNPEEVENGDYPMLYNEPKTVQEIAKELQKVDIEKILNNINFDDFATYGIYGFSSLISDDEKEDNKHWLLQVVNDLKNIYQKASDDNNAIMIAIL